jgi:hypothetical protein
MATITQNNTLAALILAAGLGPVAAQDAALETQIVDAMNKVYGVHPGFRANHAKGVVTEGTRLSEAVADHSMPPAYNTVVPSTACGVQITTPWVSCGSLRIGKAE